jgi:hypothetical protein
MSSNKQASHTVPTSMESEATPRPQRKSRMYWKRPRPAYIRRLLSPILHDDKGIIMRSKIRIHISRSMNTNDKNNSSPTNRLQALDNASS